MKHYFQSFPQITYANAAAIDITRRCGMLTGALSNPELYYPYDISSAERPDQLAYRYYGDAYASWVLYFSNQVVDPYFGWWLTIDEFNDFIAEKYGSVELAMSKTMNYMIDESVPRNLTIAGYDSLPSSLARYWSPVYGNHGLLTGYSLSTVEQFVTTNGIRSYAVSGNAVPFSQDEVVQVVFDPVVPYVGQGQVVWSNSTCVQVQHLSGYTDIDQAGSPVQVVSNAAFSSYLYGTESGANAAFSSTQIVSDTFQEDEAVYWVPQTYWEYESALNDYNRSVLVLNKSFYPTMNRNLANLMSVGT